MSQCHRILGDGSRCAEQARWFPTLNLWWKNYYGRPAKAVIGVALCDEHCDDQPLSIYITDDIWNHVVSTFTAQGKPIPDRARAKVTFVRCDDPKVRALHGAAPS